MKVNWKVMNYGGISSAVCVNVFNYATSNEVCHFYYSDIMFTTKENSSGSIGRWKIKSLKS